MKAAWLYLVLAAFAEALYGIGLYYAKGFTRLVPSLLSIVGGLLTTWLLSLSMRTLPLGLAFAIWSGLASVVTVVYGMFFLGETMNAVRIGLVALVIGGVVGLKLTSSH